MKEADDTLVAAHREEEGGYRVPTTILCFKFLRKKLFKLVICNECRCEAVLMLRLTCQMDLYFFTGLTADLEEQEI